MNITVIGSGYVGLVSGTCFAEMGNRVTCVDIDPVKIEKLNQGVIPIFEPGLETMVLKNVKNENLFFRTALLEALQNSEIAFIAVGTPMGDDGSADLQYVLTEWKEFRSPDFDKIKSVLKFPNIFDGRNQFNTFGLEEKGIEYYQIGKQ